MQIKFLVFIIVSLFYYSNLFDRIYPGIASAAFYFFTSIAVVLCFVCKKMNRWHYSVVGAASYFALLPLMKGEGFIVSLAAIKDLSLPLLMIVVGYYSFTKKGVLDLLSLLYLPFVGYGLLQVYSFHIGTLDVWLPWDAVHINRMQEGGMSVFQSETLRYFGTLNSFFHYQIICVIILALILAKRNQLKNKNLLFVNVGLALILLIVIQERAPIVFLFILSFVGVLFASKRSRLAYLAGLAIALMLVIVIGFFGGESGVNESDADVRMRNLATFQLSDDTSFNQRLLIVKEMVNLVTLENIWLGLSPANVLPSNEFGSEVEYISPHNIYLFFVLGYGLIGLLIFLWVLGFFIWILFNGAEVNSGIRFFIFALTIAYLCFGFFHLIFLSKSGCLFFWILGGAIAERYAARISYDEHKLRLCP
jgi:O-antigen ligase